MNSENVGLFSKLDIRVGKIVKAEVFEEAIKPAYILTIDFGEKIVRRVGTFNPTYFKKYLA